MTKKQNGGVAPDEDELLLPPPPLLLRQENNDLVAMAEQELRDKPIFSEYYMSRLLVLQNPDIYVYVLIRKIGEDKYELDNLRIPEEIRLGYYPLGYHYVNNA